MDTKMMDTPIGRMSIQVPSLIRIPRKAFEKKVRFLFVGWLLDLLKEIILKKTTVKKTALNINLFILIVLVGLAIRYLWIKTGPVYIEEFKLLKEYAKNVEYEEVFEVSLIKTTLNYHKDKNENWEEVPYKITVDKYDSSGNNLLSLIYFTSERKVNTAITNEYDDNGHSTIRRHYSGERELDNMDINENFYDTKSNLVKVNKRTISFYKNDTTDKTFHYEYDNNGNMTNLAGLWLFKYNSKGLKTEMESPNFSLTNYYYDSKGLLIETKMFKNPPEYGILDDNRNFSRSLYNYDNLNRNISITDYNSDESIYEFIHYEYDSSNRIIKSIHMKPDKNKLSERLYIEEKYIYEYEEIF